jgi:predicted Zn finger-like uncharacterized protein
MDIVCEQCQSKFKISDEKIPPGKGVSVACPKCKNKIIIGAERQARPSSPAQKQAADLEKKAYDASEKPFDFIEEEGKTALVCTSEDALKQPILSALQRLEYHITDAADTRDALTRMKYHVYDLIAVDESFDSPDSTEAGVLDYLSRLSMSVRRNIFVALISRRHRTMDNMIAFNQSVNMVLNVKNINDFEKIIVRGTTDNDFFYRVYRDTLKKMGKV